MAILLAPKFAALVHCVVSDVVPSKWVNPIEAIKNNLRSERLKQSIAGFAQHRELVFALDTLVGFVPVPVCMAVYFALNQHGSEPSEWKRNVFRID